MSKFVFLSKSVSLSLLAVGLAALSPGLSSFAQTTTDASGQYAVDAYALRGPQDTSAKLYLSVTTNDGQAVPSAHLDLVNVEVQTPDGQLVSQPSYTNIATSANNPAVIDLGDIPLSDRVLVHVKGTAGQDAVAVTLNTQTAVTEFAVNPRQTVVPDFEGYGAQMNMHLYTALNDPTRNFVGNEPPEDVSNVEAKVEAMHPGLCRIFLSPANYDPANQNRMDSFYKTVELAQKAGALVNITWWYIERAPNDDPAVQQSLMQQDMREFADTLIDLIKNKGLTAVRQITIQNEVSTAKWITPELYEQYYRLLDQYLRAAGLRDQIKFVGGDLPRNKQSIWFNYMADHMGDILDGWSVHIYWAYSCEFTCSGSGGDTAYMQQRLMDIKSIYNSISPEKRKPLSITEYGVRGIKTLNGEPILDLDPYRNWNGALVATKAGYYLKPDGSLTLVTETNKNAALTPTLAGYYQNPDGSLTPVNETNIAAFEQAWFNMLAINDGFVGLSKWDFYRDQYDFSYQDYSLIGYVSNPQAGQDQWPLRPSYYMEWLMDNTTGQHWQVLGQSGASGAKLITPFRGPNGQLTLFAMSTDQAASSVTIGNLPQGTEFNVLVWNADGSGKITDGGTVNAAGSGTVTVNTPAGGMVALTTVATAAPPQ